MKWVISTKAFLCTLRKRIGSYGPIESAKESSTIPVLRPGTNGERVPMGNQDLLSGSKSRGGFSSGNGTAAATRSFSRRLPRSKEMPNLQRKRVRCVREGRTGGRNSHRVHRGFRPPVADYTPENALPFPLECVIGWGRVPGGSVWWTPKVENGRRSG